MFMLLFPYDKKLNFPHCPTRASLSYRRPNTKSKQGICRHVVFAIVQCYPLCNISLKYNNNTVLYELSFNTPKAVFINC